MASMHVSNAKDCIFRHYSNQSKDYYTGIYWYTDNKPII